MQIIASRRGVIDHAGGTSTAPAPFGFPGLARVRSALRAVVGRQVHSTPAVRARQSIDDDHAVAVNVGLRDGGRAIPEIVIGPFGAAVIEELPPSAAVLTRGTRSWEVLMADGRTHLIDHPLERAARDADRLRIWLGALDTDHVVRVFVAVVGDDRSTPRTSTCASIGSDQIAAWLASLPAQRSFDPARRARLIGMIRSLV